MKRQSTEGDRPLSLRELLAAPVKNKQVRRILEFRFPITLFVEIDERGSYQIIGVPDVPGHFQLGTLVKQKEWTPARDQQAFRWETKQEHSGSLHFVSRQSVAPTEVVALVQHFPTYTRRGNVQVPQNIHLALVTPLWGDERPAAKAGRNERVAKPSHEVWHTYDCTFTAPCTCDTYQTLAQTHAYYQQQGRRESPPSQERRPT